MGVVVRRDCAVCGESFEAKRPQAKYCGDRCRKRAQRGGVNKAAAAPPQTEAVTGLVDAVRRELHTAGREDTVAGQHALELANRIVNAPGMNTGVAALSKQLQAVLAEALRGSQQVADPVDELKARRDRKRRTG